MFKEKFETFGEGAGLEPLEDPVAKEKAALKADVDRVIAEYDKKHTEEWGKDPKYKERITIQRKRGQVKYALKLYSAEELVKYLPYYFLDKRYDDQYHPITTFLSTIILNKLKIAYEKDN